MYAIIQLDTLDEASRDESETAGCAPPKGVFDASNEAPLGIRLSLPRPTPPKDASFSFLCLDAAALGAIKTPARAGCVSISKSYLARGEGVAEKRAYPCEKYPIYTTHTFCLLGCSAPPVSLYSSTEVQFSRSSSSRLACRIRPDNDRPVEYA